MGYTWETRGDTVVKDYPGQANGKTVLITGPSASGVGAQIAIFLAPAKPKHLLLAGRNLEKIQPVIDEIAKSNPDVPVTFIPLDLASHASVKKAAELVKSKVEKIDAIINNAGIMAIDKYTTTADGIETQFGSNHIGHFLLTNLLMDKILAAGPDARIINVGSFGYMSGGIHFDDPNFKDGVEYNPWIAYAQSKTANILFTIALAKKLRGKALAFTLSPGLIFESKLMANVSQELFAEGGRIANKAIGEGETMPEIKLKTLAAGAATSCYAVLAPELKDHNGAFLIDASVYTDKLREHARGEDKAEKLWVLSEKLVGQKFEY